MYPQDKYRRKWVYQMANSLIIIKNWIRRKIALFQISEVNQINIQKLYDFYCKKLDTKKTKYNTIVNLVFHNIPLQGLTA